MTTLAQRMREAADTLEEVSARCEAFDPTFYDWHAQSLRVEADHVEAEEHEAAERDAWVEELAREMCQNAMHEPLADVPKWLADSYRRAGRKLIASGWRKGEPQ